MSGLISNFPYDGVVTDCDNASDYDDADIRQMTMVLAPKKK